MNPGIFGMTGGSAAAGGKRLRTREFTGSGTWQRPPGVDTVQLFLVGGSGGSGGAIQIGDPSPHTVVNTTGGSGGGRVLQGLFPVSSIPVGGTVSVAIGSGGAAGVGANANNSGGVGGTTSFGSIATALGGGGGIGSQGAATAGWTTAGGSGSQLFVNGSQPTGYINCGGGGGGAGGHAKSPAWTTSGGSIEPIEGRDATLGGFAGGAAAVGGSSVAINRSPPTTFGPGLGVQFNGLFYGGGGLGGGESLSASWGGTPSRISPNTGGQAAPNSGAGSNGHSVTFSAASQAFNGTAGVAGYAFIAWWE